MLHSGQFFSFSHTLSANIWTPKTPFSKIKESEQFVNSVAGEGIREAAGVAELEDAPDSKSGKKEKTKGNKKGKSSRR